MGKGGWPEMNLMTLIFTIIGFTVGAIIGYMIKLIKNRWFRWMNTQ